MLFPSDKLIEQRKALYGDLPPDEILPAEIALAGLASDPFNPGLLHEAAVHYLKINDLVQAERLITRGIHVVPHLPVFYMINRGIESPKELIERTSFELALRKGHLYPETWMQCIPPDLASRKMKENPADPEVLLRMAEVLRRVHEDKRADDESAVELLFQEILDQADEGAVCVTLLGEAVALGAVIRPFFEGLIRSYADPIMEPPETRSVAVATAVLGVMGNTEHLPWMLELLHLGDDDIPFAAAWSFAQLARKYPDKAVAAIRDYAIDCDASAYPELVDQLWHLRDAKQAFDILDVLLDSIVDVPSEERDQTFLTIADAMLKVNRPVAETRLRGAVREVRRKLDRYTPDLLSALIDGAEAPIVGLTEVIVNLSFDEFCLELMGGWEDLYPGIDDSELDGEEDVRNPKFKPYDPKGKIATVDQKVGRLIPELSTEAELRKAHALFAPGLDKLSFALVKEALNTASLMDWLVNDYRSTVFPKGVYAKCIESYPEQFDEFERALLSEWGNNSFLRLFQVVALDTDKGGELKDLFTGDQFFIHDSNLTKNCSVSDYFISRVLPFEDKKILTGDGLKVDPAYIGKILDWAQNARKNQPWLQFLKANAPQLRMFVMNCYQKSADSMKVIEMKRPRR